MVLLVSDQRARLCLELQLPGPSTAHAVRPRLCPLTAAGQVEL